MPELNKANREVCDVDIRVLKTMAPYLFFDTANTTTAGLTGDSVYAMAKGAKRIGFQNPIEGTMTIEAQVYPFKLFALMSDGVVESTATYADRQVVKATDVGKLTLTLPENGTLVAGTVFAYPEDSYGDESTVIEGSFTGKDFTATETSKIAAGTSYVVGYLVTRTSGVKKVSFNNKKMPNDYYITQRTLDKDEDGNFHAFLMTAYKATIQRNFDLSFSSEGDPASVTLTFDLMEDKKGNVLDFVELDEAV